MSATHSTLHIHTLQWPEGSLQPREPVQIRCTPSPSFAEVSAAVEAACGAPLRRVRVHLANGSQFDVDADHDAVPLALSAPATATVEAELAGRPTLASGRDRVASNASGTSDEWIFLDESAGEQDAAARAPKAEPDAAYRTSLQLTINGQKHVVEHPDPRMRLVDYLRDTLHLHGTKVGCGEGGCGACTVVSSVFDPLTGDAAHRPINACLHALCMCDGATITTIEGIGSQRAGFHPVQSRLAAGNGSQCGFCSPGWCMSMYGLLQESKSPSEQDIEHHFDGNLCRCTGYRPILKAFRSFAPSSSEKESSEKEAGAAAGSPCRHDPSKRCRGSGGASGSGGGCAGSCYDDAGIVCDVEDLTGPLDDAKYPPLAAPAAVAATDPLHFGPTADGVEWFRPTSLDAVASLKREYEGKDVRVVAGNTGHGVTKYYRAEPSDPDVYIDVSAVTDVHTLSHGEEGLTVGAACTLADIVRAIQGTSSCPASWQAVADHIGHVANSQVRNAGSWAGNLMLARAHLAFPSDIYLLWATLGVTMTVLDVASGDQVSGVTPEQLFGFSSSGSMAGKDVLLVSAVLPLPAEHANLHVRTFKVMLRHVNAHALVNAGFCLNLSSSGDAQANTSPTCASARIVVGAAAKHTFRAARVEGFLAGRALDRDMLSQALPLLLKDVDDVGASTAWGNEAYRRSLVQTLFYKFYLSLQPTGSLPAPLASAAVPYSRVLSSGALSYDGDSSEYPVSKFLTKLRAPLQTSGEAVYTGDVPAPPGTLHGAFVRSTEALATLSALDSSPASAVPGFVGMVTADDIPGANDVGAFPGDEPLFVATGGDITYCQQPLALVVAESEAAARRAARAVKVTYAASKDGSTPITSLSQAIAAKSFIPSSQKASFIDNIACGDLDKGFAAAAHVFTGTVHTGNQRHFYMEPQNALVQPGSDLTLGVHTSTQDPSGMQRTLSSVLKRPAHRINVTLTRAGGGFGGKITRGGPVVAAAAVAADKLDLPVRVVLGRREDMEVTGGREPMQTSYKVGVDKNGTVVALQVTTYIDAGATVDASFGDADMYQLWADNTYFLPNYSCDVVVCRTNLPTNTAMRGPGAVQSIFVMESVMERVAAELGLSAQAVREANFYKVGQVTPFQQPIKYCSLPTLWSDLQTSANVVALRKDAASFNAANRWRKRGVSLVPTKYGISWGGVTSGAQIHIYASDGTIAVSHGGCEIGQGLSTKVAQAVAYELGVQLDIILVTPTSTAHVPNNTATGGSATSENCAKAAILACKELVQRLAPVRKAMPDKPWAQVVSAAYAQGINLSANGWCAPASSSGLSGTFNYFTWGAAVSEVEIDVLTGELEVLRSDILFDCGVSLNPAVDLGQVEGAFVQGLGYFTTEQVVVSAEGRLLSAGTWDYKPPSQLDIPIQFNASLLKDAPNPNGVLRSKASGEPPYALASSVFFAIRDAVGAARKQAGKTGWFDLAQPATPATIQQACAVTVDQLTY